MEIKQIAIGKSEDQNRDRLYVLTTDGRVLYQDIYDPNERVTGQNGNPVKIDRTWKIIQLPAE